MDIDDSETETVFGCMSEVEQLNYRDSKMVNENDSMAEGVAGMESENNVKIFG